MYVSPSSEGRRIQNVNDSPVCVQIFGEYKYHTSYYQDMFIESIGIRYSLGSSLAEFVIQLQLFKRTVKLVFFSFGGDLGCNLKKLFRGQNVQFYSISPCQL